MKISAKLTIGEFAALIASRLRKYGVETTLTGGAVVSIYTKNKYQSFDADFISPQESKQIETAMTDLGFKKKGKDFVHPDSKFYVEFPSGPLAVGGTVIKPGNQMNIKGNKLRLLSPTQAVMDRLCAFFFWNDRQGLDQAIWIAEAQNVNLSTVKKWAENEGETDKFNEFIAELKRSRKQKTT